MTRVAISLVSHGHGAMINAILGDLAKQDIVHDIVVYLTHNIPEDGVDVGCVQDLAIEVIQNPSPLGFGENHNNALAGCTADICVIMNPDVRLTQSDTIRRLVEYAAGNGGVSAPVIVDSKGNREDSVRKNLTPLQIIGRRIGFQQDPVSVTHTKLGHPFFWLAGMFLVMKTQDYHALNGFDQRFFLYCEDFDLSARAYLAGVPLIVQEDIKVIHDAQRDSHRSRKHLKWHLESLMKVWLSRSFWLVLVSQLRVTAKNTNP